MKRLLLILYIFLFSFGLAFGDSYFSLHYNNVLGSFGYSPSNDEVNICVYDNGKTTDCLNNHPSIISNTYYDNGTISGTSNSPLDNDTRFFEEKLRIGLGTMRLSTGFGTNFLEGTLIGLNSAVNANCKIGYNTIINSKSLIEHDTVIGNHCHIATGVIINGYLKTNAILQLNQNITK